MEGCSSLVGKSRSQRRRSELQGPRAARSAWSRRRVLDAALCLERGGTHASTSRDRPPRIEARTPRWGEVALTKSLARVALVINAVFLAIAGLLAVAYFFSSADPVALGFLIVALVFSWVGAGLVIGLTCA